MYYYVLNTKLKLNRNKSLFDETETIHTYTLIIIVNWFTELVSSTTLTAQTNIKRLNKPNIKHHQKFVTRYTTDDDWIVNLLTGWVQFIPVSIWGQRVCTSKVYIANIIHYQGYLLRSWFASLQHLSQRWILWYSYVSIDEQCVLFVKYFPNSRFIRFSKYLLVGQHLHLTFSITYHSMISIFFSNIHNCCFTSVQSEDLYYAS